MCWKAEEQRQNQGLNTRTLGWTQGDTGELGSPSDTRMKQKNLKG